MQPGTYRHYKGNLYEAIGVARHSETEQEMVVYRALYGEGGLWVRPLTMFSGTVLVDGREVPRFAPANREPWFPGKPTEPETIMSDVLNSAAWERLTRLLDDDELLWPQVRDALESGEQDPWEALVAGLDDAGALAYLDADDTGMELADALAQLPRVFRLQARLGTVSDTDDLEDAVVAADRLLTGHEFRLVRLRDDDDDAYALAVVPEANVPEILRLSADVGRPVRTFG